jgi:biopolymer transport protein TolQ
MGNALWQLIKQSDIVSWAVLFILLALSILCWTVFFFKLLVIRFKKQHIKTAIKKLHQVKTAEDIRTLAMQMQNTLPGYFITKYLSFAHMLREQNTSESDVKELLEQYSQQVLDTILTDEESYVSLLSTSAAVSPLLGLFGTVWGLIHAFIGISERQTADIVAIAPGIAQALTTTLAGLVVAIPAFIMFNYIQGQIRVVEQQLYVLADTLSIRMQSIK